LNLYNFDTSHVKNIIIFLFKKKLMSMIIAQKAILINLNIMENATIIAQMDFIWKIIFQNANVK